MASAGYRGVSKYVSTYTQQAAAEAPEQNSTKFLSIFDIFVHHEWAQKSHCGSDFLCPKKVKPTTLWPSSSGTFHILLGKFFYIVIRFYCRAVKI